MNDPQHRIDGVRAHRLLNPPALCSGIPFGAKIAALEPPAAGVDADVQLRISTKASWRHNGHLELVRGCRSRIQESRVATLQEIDQAGVGRNEANGHVSDIDDDI